MTTAIATETETEVRPRSPWAGGSFYIKPTRVTIWFSCIGEQTITPMAADEPLTALVYKAPRMTVLAAEEVIEAGSVRRVTVIHQSRWPSIPEIAAIRDVFFDADSLAMAIIPTTIYSRNGITICETRGLV